MDSSHIRIRQPQELLAFLPYHLGFQPEASVVAVGIRSDGERLGLMVRLDLADLIGPGGHAVAAGIIGYLVADDASRAVVVVYPGGHHDRSPDHVAAGAELADPADQAATAAQLLQAAAWTPLGAIDAWLVTETHYGPMSTPDFHLDPQLVRPIADLEGTVVGAHMVLAGSVIAASRQELATIPPASPARRRGASQANLRALNTRPLEEGERLDRWRRRMIRTWLDLVSDRQADPARCEQAAALGRLNAGLSDTPVRDTILTTLVCPTASTDPEVPTESFAQFFDWVLDPGQAPGPDTSVARAAEGVLRQIVAHAPAGRRAPALSLLGWLFWWSGKGAQASAMLTAALEEQPDYQLASLLLAVVEVGMAPGWARAA